MVLNRRADNRKCDFYHTFGMYVRRCEFTERYLTGRIYVVTIVPTRPVGVTCALVFRDEEI